MPVKNSLQDKAKLLFAQAMQHAREGVGPNMVAAALATAAFTADDHAYLYNKIREEASALAATDRHASEISSILHTEKKSPAPAYRNHYRRVLRHYHGKTPARP